jgi:hypothetical protein
MSFGFGFGFPRRAAAGGAAPSLNFDFTSLTSLPGRITFSRTSNATLTDSNGRVSYAPHNLLTNSEDFEAAAWTKTDASITANATTAPDGAVTGDKLVEAATLSSHYAAQSVTTAALPHSYSVYVKAAERSFVLLWSATANFGRVFNLSNGTVSGTVAGVPQAEATISDAGNGWYRCTIYGTCTAASNSFRAYTLTDATTFSYTGTTGSGIFIWGAQLNVANAPVNLLTFSEQFDNAVWSKLAFGSGSVPVVTANASIAPDGTLTADRVLFNCGGSTASDRSALLQVVTGLSLGQSYVGTVWIKANTPSDVGKQLRFVGDSVLNQNIVTLTADWQRVSASGTCTLTVNNNFIIETRGTFTTNQTADFLIWGAQLNTGSTALPYVATTSSIYLPPSYNSTTPKNLLGFTQEFDNAAWTKSNSFVQTNLLTFSEDLNGTGWTKIFAGTGTTPTITSNYATAPNGTTTASRLVGTRGASNTTADYSLSVSSNATVVAGVAYTGSIYIKSNTGSDQNVTIYVVTGAAIQQSIAVAGSSWTRVTLPTLTATTTPCNIVIGTRGGSYGGDQSLDILVWGAQLVQGSVPGDYQVTTSAAAAVQYSDPNGTRTADKLVEDTAASTTHLLLSTTDTAVINGTRYTSTIYAKAGERSWFALQEGQGVTATAYFNLASGVVGTISGTGSPTASITSIGSGWYRCSLSWTASGVAARLRAYLATGDGTAIYTGDGTSGIYIWGAQLSNSASVDSYVYNPQAAPTSTAYYGPRFDYNPTGTPVLGSQLVTNGTFDTNLSGWTLSQTVTASLPSWSSGAMKLLSDGTGFSIADQSITTVAGVTYQFSLFVTYPGSGTLDVRVGTTQGASDLLASTNISAGGTFTYTFVATGTTSWIRIRTGSNNATGYLVDNVSVQAVTGYTATANGLLIEEQRVNLFTYSQDFSNAFWQPTNITVTNSATTAPDGTNTAQSIAATATVSTLLVSAATTVSATSATYSIYAKQGSGANLANTFLLRNNTTATNLLGGTINYSTGAFTYSVGSTGVTVQNVGNSWWRIVMTVTSGVTAGDGLRGYIGFTGGTETAGTFLYAWGAQLEAGSFATSYIPTVASQVTRAADNASMLGDNFLTWYNQTQGTFSLGYAVETTASQDLFMANAGAPLTASIGMYTSSPQVLAWVRDGGVTQANMGVTATLSTTNKAALAYAVNDFAISSNGGTVATDTSGTVPTMTKLNFGANNVSSGIQGAWIRSFAYYPTRLANATLQSITA